jgi:AcrR family transcriptional regulator
MPVKSRRAEYAEATRAAIIDAAIARFAEAGFAGTTIDDIAESARVTKGGVYHHFRDKAELFEAAFVAIEERLLATVAASSSGLDEPWEILRAGLDAFLVECRDPVFRRMALEEAPAALGWVRWKEIEDRYFLGVVRATIEGLAAAGGVELQLPDLTAKVLLAAMHEAGMSVASAGETAAERERVHRLVMRMFETFAHPDTSD